VVLAGFWWRNVRERPLWKTRCRWEDNIRIELQAVGRGAWTVLIWRRLVNAVTNLWVP
jgi:hypothetical protein